MTMGIRFNFVAMSMKLKNASPSRTITYKSYEKLPDNESKLYQLKKDVHHYKYNPGKKSLQDLLFPIFSSAKSQKQFRHHTGYIDIRDFMKFLHITKELDENFDIMIEAKMKDLATLKLFEDLERKKGVKFVEKGVIEV